VQEQRECCFWKSFQPELWQILSQLWQTLYLLGVQIGCFLPTDWGRQFFLLL